MNQIIEKQRKRNEEKVKELTNITLIHVIFFFKKN